MKLDEIQKVWQSQDARMTVQTTILLESVRRKQRGYAVSLWIRYLREGWGAIFAAVLFLFITESSVSMGSGFWPFYVALAIICGTGVFRVIDYHRQKQKAPHYSESTLSFIESSLADISHRIWLLENILWWWVLPMAVAGCLIIFQILLIVGWHHPSVFMELGVGAAIFALILVFIYWGNLLTARKYWQPRRADLQALADRLKIK